MKNLRIAELLFNQPLMITEAKLNVILHVLGPRFQLDMSGFPAQQAAVLSDEDRYRAGYAVRDGVAVIGIYGPLLHRRMASDYPSGGPTTYGEVRQSFDTALSDDGVSSILLDIDSPGGMVSGAFDLADHIYQARGLKPITALVNEQACSSGFLLASSADRILMPRTAEVGSVGVIATHADFSRAEDAAGITVTHVYAGARKADFSPHMPLSPAAVSDLQASVQETYQLFVETVARNRGMASKAVRGTEAAIFGAREAIEIGFADEISTFTSALANAGASSKNRSITVSAGPIGKEPQIMNLEELKIQHPDLCQALIGEGQQAAIAAERTRVMSILEIPGPAAKAHGAVLLEGIRSGQSAGDVALALQHKEANLLHQAAADIRDGAPPPAPPADPGAGIDAGAATAQKEGDAMEKAAAAWAQRN